MRLGLAAHAAPPPRDGRVRAARAVRVVGVDLVGELAAPDRLAALARARRVAGLNHEARHEAVEGRAVVRAGRG